MRTITSLLYAIGLLASAANAQTGTIYACDSQVASIGVSSTEGNGGELAMIAVTSGYGSQSAHAFVANRIVATRQGNVIDVTMTGFTFSLAPSHWDTCGAVTVGPIPSGRYTINLFLDIQAPQPELL